MLGVALGEYFVGRCTGGHKFKKRKFRAGVIDGAPTVDFNPFHADQKLDFAPAAGKLYSTSLGPSIAQSSIMANVWDRARKEWEVRFP